MAKTKRLFILIVWMLVILALVAMPADPGAEEKTVYLDKAAHFFLFGIMGALVLNYLSAFKNITKIWAGAISLSAAMIYAAFSEYLQLYIPGRNAAEADFAAGAIGAIVFIYFIYGRIFEAKK